MGDEACILGVTHFRCGDCTGGDDVSNVSCHLAVAKPTTDCSPATYIGQRPDQSSR